MTIRDLLIKHAHLFYRQDWYWGESFLDDPLPVGCPKTVPTKVGNPGVPPNLITWYMTDVQPAVVLAWLYVLNPEASIWSHRLWTSSEDKHGQRVYVCDNGKGLEIHRFLHITDQFGVASW